MKAAAISMLVIFIALLALVWRKDGAAGLQHAARASGETGLKFIPILVLAILVMGAVEVLLEKEMVDRWLSDASGWRGLVTAWIAGALTPGGSIMGLPIAAGLHKAGAAPAVLITYLVSLATLSMVRIPIELGILGPRLTALRVASSLVLPLIAGSIVRALGFLRI